MECDTSCGPPPIFLPATAFSIVCEERSGFDSVLMVCPRRAFSLLRMGMRLPFSCSDGGRRRYGHYRRYGTKGVRELDIDGVHPNSVVRSVSSASTEPSGQEAAGW